VPKPGEAEKALLQSQILTKQLVLRALEAVPPHLMQMKHECSSPLLASNEEYARNLSLCADEEERAALIKSVSESVGYHADPATMAERLNDSVLRDRLHRKNIKEMNVDVRKDAQKLMGEANGNFGAKAGREWASGRDFAPSPNKRAPLFFSKSLSALRVLFAKKRSALFSSANESVVYGARGGVCHTTHRVELASVGKVSSDLRAKKSEPVQRNRPGM
jgi:hypothetical protein